MKIAALLATRKGSKILPPPNVILKGIEPDTLSPIVNRINHPTTKKRAKPT
jgi:hypothetical protein